MECWPSKYEVLCSNLSKSPLPGVCFSSNFFYIHFCVCVGGYVHVGAGAYGSQKRASGPLELGLEVLVSCPTWILGTSPGHL